MWFFGSEAFLSVVQHRQNPDILIVRARRPGHIEKMFPAANVVTIDGRDYQFRAELPREVVAIRMQQYVMEMTATNFKDSVKDKIYHDACFGVWNCMERIQPLRAYSLYSNKGKRANAWDGPLFGQPARPRKGKR
ncbi:hypothetical protein Q6I89_004403 [Salmonella enterica]|nr:hypothetical protein [Salmonella enterica]EFF4796195.1 hypothetical protein [Escherichia coli]EJD1942371.1 hypothetical protein [Escherichia coli]EJM1834523.1 hypothetical protein [Salmonella enterica]EJT3914100.1 hypothetical protein [Salmonella enterica]